MRSGIALFACTAAAAAQAADLRVSVVDGSSQPVANAVVYATPVIPPPHESHQASIDQVHRQFVPQVNVVQAGTAISFPNSDNIRHSVYSFSPARPFTLKLYAGTPARPVIFDRPGVVVMGCNIHDTMVAWVLVVDTPYYARTGADGTAVITELPAGDYRLRAWNNSMSEEQSGEELSVGAQSLSPRQLHVDGQPVASKPM
jgi:plastocyanin